MAARYWIGTGTGNWNSATNWSATSGGATGASVPTSVDDTFFDANGNNNSTISATITVKSMTIDAGYTATMTHNAVLTVAGNVTLGANYTIAGSSSMTISAASTITSNGKTWPNELILSASNITYTLVGDLTVSGVLLTGVANGSAFVNKTTSEVIYANGGLQLGNTGTGRALSGTADVYLQGGTFASNTGGLQNKLFIKPLFSDVILSGALRFTAISSITYIPSTYNVDASTSTLIFSFSNTLDCDGIIFNNISINSGGLCTLTINSLLTLSGTLTLNTNITNSTKFDGTHGFICSTLLDSSVNSKTAILQEGITYTITSAFNCFSSRVGSIVLFTSSHASNKAILTLQNPAACNVLASFTRIDASNGRTIPTFNGTITDCLNILEFHDLPTSSHAL
jgi:hypothetical protein